MTFAEAKKETYSLFDDRCRELLDDFLSKKNEAVCSKCSQSCSDGKKIHRILRNLIEGLTIEAAKRCDDKVDFFMCLLCPYLSSEALLRSVGKGKGKGKRLKSLVTEMERSGDRLQNIINGGEKHERKN